MEKNFSEYPPPPPHKKKKKLYINGFALSLAVKQRLMEQLWYYPFHVCPIFCKFHKNRRFCWGPLNLLFHCFALFGEFLNFAEIFQFFSNLQFSKKITGLVEVFLTSHLLLFTNAVNFHISGNFCNCMQTWTYLCILVVYTPLKQKPKKVGNKLGKFTFFYYYCVSLFIG